MSACATICETNIEKAIQLAQRFSIAEIRLDLCGFEQESISRMFASHPNLIATYRSDKLNDENKMMALKCAIESGASMVDLEIEAHDDIKRSLTELCKGYPVKLILSYHNFERTEDIESLRKIVEVSKSQGADYVKIATKTHSKLDIINLLRLYQEYDNIIAFGMGEHSKFTRWMCLHLGAPFTYVYDEESSNQLAEGQLSASEYDALKDIFKLNHSLK